MTILHILFLFLAFATAAPPSPQPANSPTSPRTSSSSTHLPITRSHTAIHTQSVPIFSRPPSPASGPIVPVHTHTRPPPPFQNTTSNSNSTQKPISIAFEVLGGLFGSLILIGLIRCCINYKKTPNRDRIADILHRHNLQRELAELERNPDVLRRPSLREPAPPYFPRPPSYRDMNPPETVRSVPQSEYSAASTSSPPPSPPMSQRDLPGPTVTARTAPELIPQIPQIPSS